MNTKEHIEKINSELRNLLNNIELDLEIKKSEVTNLKIIKSRIEQAQMALFDYYSIIENQKGKAKTFFGINPESRIGKLKLFVETFNSLSGLDKKEVEQKELIKELCKTGKFLEDDAKDMIDTAMKNGQIFQTRSGYYGKA